MFYMVRLTSVLLCLCIPLTAYSDGLGPKGKVDTIRKHNNNYPNQTINIICNNSTDNTCDKEANQNGILFKFTLTDVLIAVATVLLVVVGIFQRQSMEKALESARAANERQARETQDALAISRETSAAASKSANAAVANLSLTLWSWRITQRPYVFIEPPDWRPKDGIAMPNMTIWVKIHARNGADRLQPS